MNATPYPDINLILHTLTTGIQQILPQKLAGLYLYGSLVWGDFDEAISDIDLLAAIHSELTDAELEALNRFHLHVVEHHPRWNDRLEIAYLSVKALQTFKTTSSPIAVISPGEPFHFKTAGKDWLINWYMVREKGVALVGPAPQTLIPSITGEEFIHAVKEHVNWWEHHIHEMRRRPQQAYAILTLCRALYACTSGEQASKRRAALWAQQMFPEWSSFINEALHWRESYRDEGVDHESTFPETLRFVQFIIAEIKRF